MYCDYPFCFYYGRPHQLVGRGLFIKVQLHYNILLKLNKCHNGLKNEYEHPKKRSIFMSIKENSTGRPTKKDPEVVTKLTSAFSKGFTIKEACAYSGIARETFYRWMKDYHGFYDKIQHAKAKLNIRAKEVIVDAINGGDVNSAKWWLAKYDGPDKIDDNLSFNSKLLKEIVSTKERLIAYRYRKVLFSEREILIAEKKYSKKLTPQIERLDRLIKLSDADLSNYAELELSSLGSDKAGVREEILDRNKFNSMIKDEIDSSKLYGV